ncbi:histidine phosphatase family protein [Dickeya zeae]|uniref:histidine phosphatase family protein n=1 Tax=Dickeya zeae TaxID=204042 RepID=UPI001F1CEFC2|nr:histidine phosphatase family protein [Dickeya zeae]UJR63069.1 histidine phosphatase family protein [Dickeya zeae]
MELYLLRHGMSIANEKKLVCGASDYPLSSRGIEQASKICKELGGVTFSRVYSSPLSRAVNTIANLRNIKTINIEEDIKELNTGDVSHITLSELWSTDERFRKPWLFPDLRYPGGETFREMVTRISGWYHRKSGDWLDNERVLIVGHEGTLRSIYLNLMGLNISNYPDFPIGNCDYLFFKLTNASILCHKHIKLDNLDGEVN